MNDRFGMNPCRSQLLAFKQAQASRGIVVTDTDTVWRTAWNTAISCAKDLLHSEAVARMSGNDTDLHNSKVIIHTEKIVEVLRDR